MSTTKKVLIAIFSIIIIAAFAFLITWGVINFNKVKEGLAGTGLYTKDDVDNAFNDGYNTALADKSEYENLIEEYKKTISFQTNTITQLNNEKNSLNASIAERVEQVDNLTSQRDALQVQVDLLKESIDSKDGIIGDMNDEQQALIEEHQKTIDRLNGQIAELNTQIESLNTTINADMSTVGELNNTIAELQKTIAYYEGYLGQLETQDKAIVTFEFAGSVYEVKTVNKGDKVYVANPTSTEYVIFNGWMLDGEPLDLSTFTVTGNVRIIADVTYKYVVNFVVDGNVKSSQVVEKGEYVSEPSKPKKTGFTFKYWTLDGETEVHFDQYPIMQNTTFVAKFNELYTVNFIAEGETLATRRIERGAKTSPVAIESTDYRVFNGWTVNGKVVDVLAYPIMEATDFIADFTYKHKVVFKVGEAEYATQMVADGESPNAVGEPVLDGYVFVGWSIDGSNAVDLTHYTITEDTNFIALIRRSGGGVSIFNVTYMNGNDVFWMEQVEINGHPTLTNFPVAPSGYKFKGWATTKGGIDKVNLNNFKITEDTTFYAIFEEENPGILC